LQERSIPHDAQNMRIHQKEGSVLMRQQRLKKGSSSGGDTGLKASDAGVRALIEEPFHLCGFSFQCVAPAQSCRRPSMDAAVQLAALRAENARPIELLAAKDQLITHLITSKAELVTCKDELLASRTAELQNPRRLPAVQHFETYL
jgi:hypothetical protein